MLTKRDFKMNIDLKEHRVAAEAAEKSLTSNAIYLKSKADCRKEAIADIRQLLGITNENLE